MALILITMGIRGSFRGSTPISLRLHGANLLERERARGDGMRDIGVEGSWVLFGLGFSDLKIFKIGMLRVFVYADAIMAFLQTTAS